MIPFPLLTDSYKLTHWKQYPRGIRRVYSYFESRGGLFPQTVFFGLQYILKRYFEGRVLTMKDIERAEQMSALHFGSHQFNSAGWRHILNDHGGKLPLSIKSVPEGTVVFPTHNVLITVENTCDECYWLTNWAESLLVQVWYPVTVATLSWHARKIIEKYLRLTGDVEGLPFKLHDFGFRGVSSVESAGIGGAAHLVNFKGTDTLAGIVLAHEYYGEPMAGFSIPAAEHSTITSWGRTHEGDAMENMLNQYPTGLVAVVSDSYNIFEACEKIWGERLRAKVLGRNGTVIIRPDSGDAITVILKVLEILGDKFGYRLNKKGYKVLDDHVRIIQGDGVDLEMIEKILQTMQEAGWSADNIAFGMGGALLQKLHRDTQKMAFKCSAICVEGFGWLDVFKEPITDPGKNSKRGRFVVHRMADGTIKTLPLGSMDLSEDMLVEVFRNGEMKKEWCFEEIRRRAQET